VDREVGPDPFAGLKSSSEEYSVYDNQYERIGRVDDVFIDERDAVSYIGVKMGFFGTNSTLVPVEIVRVNDLRRLIEIDEDAETIKHAPHFGHDETVSPELEDRVRTYFGLEPLLPPEEPSDGTGRFGPDARVDIEPGERVEEQERLAGMPAGEPAATPTADEPPDVTPGDRWDREVSEGGVIVHRRRG
jgi:PRC-barrel domain